MKNIVTLDDVCKVKASKIIQKSLINLKGIYPVYGATGFIKNVDFYEQDEEYIAIVKDGAGIGKTMLLPKKSSILSTMQYILPKENIDIKYLYYAISYMDLRKYFTGATIPHIYFKDYKKEKLSLPNKQEQRNIVSKLISIDKLIELKKQQIIILNKLVSSLFIEMFGDPVKNPMNFKYEKLVDLGYLGRGVSKHRPRNDSKLLGGKYPLIQTGDIAKCDLFIQSYNTTYSEVGFKQSKIWKSGTLCITIAGNIAKTGILKFNSCFPDSIVGFISNDKVNNIYIHYWFSFFQKILEMQAPKSAQKNINLKILGELKVMLPYIERQNQFAERVQQIDKSKLAIQQSLEKLEILKKSLMQEYFS